MPKITPLGWLGIIILFNSTLIGGASQLGDLSLSIGTVKAILAAATLGNAFLGGLVTMFSTQSQQISNVVGDPQAQEALVRAVLDMRGVSRIGVNEKATPVLAALATDPEQPKIGPVTPDLKPALVETAKAAS